MMLKLKKVFMVSSLSVTLLSMSQLPAVTSVVFAGEQTVSAAAQSSISPRAEETVYKYRVVDGKLQKRLWSLTYGKWLTDWEWV